MNKTLLRRLATVFLCMLMLCTVGCGNSQSDSGEGNGNKSEINEEIMLSNIRTAASRDLSAEEEKMLDAAEKCLSDIKLVIDGYSIAFDVKNTTEYDFDGEYYLALYDSDKVMIEHTNALFELSSGEEIMMSFPWYNDNSKMCTIQVQFAHGDAFYRTAPIPVDVSTLVDSASSFTLWKSMPMHLNTKDSYTNEISEYTLTDFYYVSDRFDTELYLTFSKESGGFAYPDTFYVRSIRNDGVVVDIDSLDIYYADDGDTLLCSVWLSDLAPGDYTVEIYGEGY